MRAITADAASPPRAIRTRWDLRYPLEVLALAVGYWGAAQLGYALDFAGPVAAIVWLPVGVGVSALYIGGLRLWPGVLLGDLLANDYGALPFGSALGQTAGNVLEMLAAAWLLRRLLRDAPPLGSVRGLTLLLVSLVAGTLVSATVGVTSLRLGGVLDTDQMGQVWRTWWLGDFAGALVVVPLAIAWFRPMRPDGWNGGIVEAVLVMLAVVGLTNLAFVSDGALTYIVFPALLWAALRFGARGATLAVALAVSLTIYDTANFDGPFSFESITRTVLSTQLYIAVLALSALCLAAVVSERERFSRRLDASRERLVAAGDTARERLQHDLHDGAQQRLTALAVRLGVAADATRDDAAGAPGQLEDAREEVLLAIEELRQLARGLHPTVLAEFGLAAAMQDVAARSPLAVTLAELPAVRVSERAEVAAYFVFTEALANAQKHSRAATIVVRAAVNGRALRVEIADDGVGGAIERPGSGLEGLRDRVEAIGGEFGLESERGGGTRVHARVPLQVADADRILD
jgi:signal transduction histidine kinase